MLADLVQKLLDIGRKEVAVKAVHPESEPKHRYALVNRLDGSVTWKDAEPEPRKHVASTIGDLCRFATDKYCPDFSGSVIWYHRSGITLLCHDDSRRDRVSLPLTYSPQTQKLAEWEKNRPQISQKELILTLRTTFKDSLGAAGNLIEVLRKLKMKVNTQGESEIGHGKASIGRSIEAEVTGAGSIPEYVILFVPVFVQPFAAWPFQVQCALEPDAGTNTFQMIPIPGQLESAMSQAEDALAEAIAGHLGEDFAGKIPAYRGVP